MYIFGIWLAAYYDWWLVRTATKPTSWAVILFIVPNLFMLTVNSVPFFLWLTLYPVVVILFIPAFLAAWKNKKKADEVKSDAWSRVVKTNHLIDRGKK